MKEMKKRETKIREYGMLGILTLESFFLIYINLFKYKYIDLDFDTTSIIGTAKEMLLQRSVFLENWGYQTTMLIDSPIPLVAGITMLTNNLLLSQGIVNCILLLVLIFGLKNVLRKIGVTDFSKLFGITIVLMPYGFEYLGYSWCLTTGSACYLVRFIMLIQTLNIFLDYIGAKRTRYTYANLVVMYLLSYFATFSSGVHYFMVGVIPYVMAMIYFWKDDDNFIKNRIINKKDILYVGYPIASFAGILMAKVVSFGDYANKQNIISLDTFWDNIHNCIAGVFALFNGIPSGEVQVLSIQGICYLIRFFVVILFFISIFYVIKKILHSEKTDEKCKYFVLVAMFLWNIFVLFFTENVTEGYIYSYRYHIFTFAPVFIMISIFCDKLTEYLSGWNHILRNIFYLIIICAITLNTIVGYSGKILSINENDYFETEKLVEAVQEQGIHTILVYDDVTLVRQLNVMDLNNNYIDYRADGRAVTWGMSYKCFDGKNIGERALLIAHTESDIEYFKNKCKIEISLEMGNYIIYELTDIRLDFSDAPPGTKYLTKGITQASITGKATSKETIDYPYTPGFIYDENLGRINDNGYLVSNGAGGCILSGPKEKLHEGKYIFNVQLDSNSNDVVGSLRIVYNEGETILGETSITAGEEVNLEINVTEDVEDYECQIWVEEGKDLTVKKIIISRQ